MTWVPCPFCQSTNIRVQEHGSDAPEYKAATCQDCGAQGPRTGVAFTPNQEAALLWNQRDAANIRTRPTPHRTRRAR